MIRLLRSCGVIVVASLAVACGEKPQTATASVKKVDGKVWEASDNAYVAPGWKAGDRTSWEEQMRKRAESQNDYATIK